MCHLKERLRSGLVALALLFSAALPAVVAAQCTSACDCPTGQLCASGRCFTGIVPVYCCDRGVCPAAGRCDHTDGSQDFCPGTGCCDEIGPACSNDSQQACEQREGTFIANAVCVSGVSQDTCVTRTPTRTSLSTPTPTRTATATHTATASPTTTPTPTVRPCTGDCDLSGRVSLPELVLCLRIVNGNRALGDCPPCDRDGDGPDLRDLVLTLRNANDGGCR